MKKGLILIIFVCCFILAGCGNIVINYDSEEKNGENGGSNVEEKVEQTPKTSVMVCSHDTQSTVNFTTNMIYYFEDDNLVKLGVKYVYDLSSYTEAQRKGFANAKMCDYEDIKTKLGMPDCQEELSGTNYIVTGTADKLLEEAKATPSEVMESYTKQGWTCSYQ